jgi:hypothetical protein
MDGGVVGSYAAWISITRTSLSPIIAYNATLKLAYKSCCGLAVSILEQTCRLFITMRRNPEPENLTPSGS